MRTITKKKWKRILIWGGSIFLGSIILGVISFSILLFNPFESDFKGFLFSLIPIESETVFYVQNPGKLQGKIKNWLAWQELVKTPEYRDFIRSPLYDKLRRKYGIDEIRMQRDSISKNTGVDILDWKYLSEVIGREVAISLRPSDSQKEQDFLVITRISWKCKLVDSLIPYVISKEIRENLQLSFKEEIKSVQLPDWGVLYWARHRDLLFLSNAKGFLQTSFSIAQTQRGSLDIALQKRLQDITQQGDIVFYSNNRPRDTQENQVNPSSTLIEKIFPWQQVVSWVGVVAIHKQLEITIDGTLNEKLGQEQNRFRKIKWNIVRDLPAEILFYAVVPVEPQKFWTEFQELWAVEWRRELAPHMDKLNREYHTKDAIEDCCAKYLGREAVIVLSTTNFVKENLEPFEPYPTFAIIFNTPHAREFFAEIEKMMEKIRSSMVENSQHTKFTFFVKDFYADRAYLRIKYPDTSGGAVQPAIGVVDSYVVITSHSAFFKELVDINDQIGTSWAQSSPYSTILPWKTEEHGLMFFADPDRIISTSQKLQKKIVQWVIENTEPQKRNIPAIQRDFHQFMEILQHSQMLKIGLGMHFDMMSNQTKGKIFISVQIRR